MCWASFRVRALQPRPAGFVHKQALVLFVRMYLCVGPIVGLGLFSPYPWGLYVHTPFLFMYSYVRMCGREPLVGVVPLLGLEDRSSSLLASACLLVRL